MVASSRFTATTLSILLGCALTMPASTRLAAEELRLDARAIFAKSVSNDVRLSAEGLIELDWGSLYEDDGPAAGFSYKPNEEKLSETTWIKKQFHLPEPRSRRATLLVAPGGKLRAVINGKPLALSAPGKADQYWQTYILPTELLKPGENELILYGSGKLWIARDDEFAAGSLTRTSHPNRSSKSTDAGKTWDGQRLGTTGNLDGEYYVRLFLDQQRPRGSLTLPVIDLGNLAGKAVAAPLDDLPPVRFALTVANQQAGNTQLHVRSGSTPLPPPATIGIEKANTWSAWQTLEGLTVALKRPQGRYLQVKLEIVAADPSQGPQVKGLVIEAAPGRTPDWTKNLRILELHNEEIVRSSIPFAYEPFDHPRLKMLRERYRLDEVVKGAEGDLQLAARLAAWSARQWQRGHLKEGYPPWDALEILTPHADGGPVGGFCQQYNIVFLQACESFGLVGRAVSLGSGEFRDKIRSGHEVVEIWCSEHKKWVYVDGQFAWHLVDGETGVPLSLVDLRDRQLPVLRGKPTSEVRLVKHAEAGQDWQGLGGFPPFVELRLIPRSNFLQQKAPLPLNQGMRGWFWTGHHVWTDDDVPAPLLYGNRVRQRRDWEWTLNQARIRLEATGTPGMVRVHLDTETPGFETFLVEIDDKEKRPSGSGFLWQLHSGKNRLQVRPRNNAGREGIPSRILLDYVG